MVFAPGSRFGPYEVTDQIGAGGMGVVYRATDTKLKRDVAIKVLPASLAKDAERLARFQREAEVLASLNHPNVAHIHGLEESEGTIALILELVEGPTLAERIEEGPLAIAEALGIATQIADALEAAHGQGIVHRDLKPANVKMKHDGLVKVLDFGIAKALDIRAASGLSPVMETPAVTETGIILGTAAYMSPEQARSKGIDQRTDIWAFGCVLYEMLTGQQAFGGEDVTVMLARILEREPDMAALSKSVSSSVRHTIELCLRKDVRTRVADIRDVRLALAGEFESVSPELAAAHPRDRSVWRRALPLAASAVVAGFIVAIVMWSRMQPEPPSVTRFVYDVPQDQGIRGAGLRVLAIAPDGRFFAYNTVNGVYLRAMDALEPRLIPGTQRYLASIRFSPDGQSLAYVSGAGFLERIGIGGDVPVPITEVEELYGMSWQRDGTVLYGQPGGIYRVSANGGTSDLVIPSPPEGRVYGPQLLPDGDSVLFSETTAVSDSEAWDWDDARIVVQSLSTGERTVLPLAGSDARYLPTGHIVFTRGETLFAVPFDPETFTVSGGTVPVAQAITRAGDGHAANYDVADNGTLTYLTGGTETESVALFWVDRQGREEPLSLPRGNYMNPRLSPDGRRLAYNVGGFSVDVQDVWVVDVEGGAPRRVTFDARAAENRPLWTPDGRSWVYLSNREEGVGIFQKAVDGTGIERRLTTGWHLPETFSPDGELLVFRTEMEDDSDLRVVSMDGSSTDQLLIGSQFEEIGSAISPDGHWIAYSSNESGRFEVYVKPFPDVENGRWQVTTDGGFEPLWAPDGAALFYRNGDATMAVSVDGSEAVFSRGDPEVMFTGDYWLGGNLPPSYDISPDGSRFLMMRVVAQGALRQPSVVVVESWFNELGRLVPRN